MALPIKKYVCGQVSAAVWGNEGKDGEVRHSFTLSKRYFDKTANEWKNTDSFSLSDAPLLDAVIAELKKHSVITIKPEAAAEKTTKQKIVESSSTANDDSVPF